MGLCVVGLAGPLSCAHTRKTRRRGTVCTQGARVAGVRAVSVMRLAIRPEAAVPHSRRGGSDSSNDALGLRNRVFWGDRSRSLYFQESLTPSGSAKASFTCVRRVLDNLPSDQRCAIPQFIKKPRHEPIERVRLHPRSLRTKSGSPTSNSTPRRPPLPLASCPR